LPELTAEGINGLIQQLDADLNAVQASGASPATKQDLKDRITVIKNRLTAGAAEFADGGGGAAAAAGWVSGVAPLFAALAPRLHQAMTTITGACLYQGGCIQTTQAQCQALQGTFAPGQDCP
jgi:hypothetical protein